MSASGSSITGRTPAGSAAGETYEHNGGRGFYFLDPDGHLLEVMTRPYAIDE